MKTPTDTLKFLNTLLGPEQLAQHTRPLTAAETAAIDAFIEQHPDDFPADEQAVTALQAVAR